jgi:hypothetical protein
MNLSLEHRQSAFQELGNLLRQHPARLEELIQSAQQYNGWFTPENTRKAVNAIAGMFDAEALESWISQWQQDVHTTATQNIGLILAGNIPMVGFHDILCVLMAGHQALIKLSSQDKHLTPYILEQLIKIEPGFASKIAYVEKLENFDAVIATGSNNSSRYFEYYFGKVPHIIRKNRNSIAVITGDETQTELQALGADIFDYFGLGCRNVSKLYVPENYDFKSFFESIQSYQGISDHHKYLNNYDYNKSIFLVNGDPHLDNGFLLLKADEKLASPLAVLHYEHYRDLNQLSQNLKAQSEQIQCIACQHQLEGNNQVVSFGCTQIPRLWDYADGINLMDFLLKEINGK